MFRICSYIPEVRFPAVREAMEQADIELKTNSQNAVLIWYDTIKEVDYYSKLLPWQIVNRIPNMNNLCRKAPFIFGLQRIQKYYPNLITFFPKSYILPAQDPEFVTALALQDRSYIVKPDGGSFGRGITVVNPGQPYQTPKVLSVAQEYIDSFLIDNTKFDLRVYVLVASISPLRIYVYRNGVARFCSQQVGPDSPFSQLTNVGLNKKKPGVEISRISRLISDVLPVMEKLGVDTKALWKKIDKAVALTIISGYGNFKRGEQRRCPSHGYSRCFHLLGFDVLLDKQHNPYILEVNIRPSLKYYRGKEGRMKIGMLRDVMRIASPMASAQAAFFARKWAWNEDSWQNFIDTNPAFLDSIQKSIDEEVARTKFVQVFPPTNPDDEIWNGVIDTVLDLPDEDPFDLNKVDEGHGPQK